MFKLKPERLIPEEYRSEYRLRIAFCFKNRILILCASITAIFFGAITASLILFPEISLFHRAKVFAAICIGSALILFMNRKAGCEKCIYRSKTNAILFILYILIVSHFAAEGIVNGFSYANYIIFLFFSLVLLPWTVMEAGLLALMQFAAFFIYASVRDLSVISFPPTIFGSDPLLNGFAHLIISAVMCLIIRYHDNARDVNNFLMIKDIEKRKNQMEQELLFASRIQNSLVPQPFNSKIADVFITYRPVGSIGGDYANFQLVDDKHLIFFIGDVTGHGVPAALMVNRLHTEFDRLASSGQHPGTILKKLNQFIVRAFDGTNMYLTAFCGMVNAQDQKIYYSNYGHPPQYIYRLHNSEVTGLEAQTSLLGLELDDGNAIYEKEIEYKAGDMVFLFTDGILELKNQSGEEYGGQRLKQFIREHFSLAQEEMHGKLIKDLLSFGYESFKDDVFMISIKCKAKSSFQIGDILKVPKLN